MQAPEQQQEHTASWTLLRRLTAQYLRPHYATVGVSLLLMALAAGMTGALAKLMEPIIDEVFSGKNQSMVVPVALAVFGAFVLRGAATYGHSVLMNRVGQRIVASAQGQLYAHLIRSDMAFFQDQAAGQLIARMIADVNIMRMATAECITGIGRSTLTLLFLTAVMFWQDWQLALSAFVVFPLAAWFVARLGRRLRQVATRSQIEIGMFSALLNQAFQGVRQVKAYGMERFEERRAGERIENLFELEHQAFRVSALSTPMTEILSGVAIVTIIAYGGQRVIEGESTAGALFSFITAFLLAYEPIKRLAKLNATLQRGLAAADRVFKMLDTPHGVTDRADAVALVPEKADIALEHVTFRYPDDTLALDDVSLSVAAGSTVALVGPSGAGKTTILNLIPRFYDVASGRVMVCGQDVRDVTQASLRDCMALVSQEVAIFDDTIRANIAYGRIDATDEAIEAAARAASAHDFIAALPEGYSTRVGENGLKLSGGQRQRIAIARAMLRNAPILLLDEATSALDTESERAVQAALKRLQAGRTTLVVAHRLSTIVDSDKICVFERGRMVESGNHSELLARGGLYARLYGGQADAADIAPAGDGEGNNDQGDNDEGNNGGGNIRLAVR